MITEGISKALADLRAAGCGADADRIESALTKAEAQHHVNLLGQAITDAAHKAGITRADAVIDGPTLLMLCNDLAEAAGRADAVPGLREAFDDLVCTVDAVANSGDYVLSDPAAYALQGALEDAKRIAPPADDDSGRCGLAIPTSGGPERLA